MRGVAAPVYWRPASRERVDFDQPGSRAPRAPPLGGVARVH
jgi:hypothetical protein